MLQALTHRACGLSLSPSGALLRSFQRPRRHNNFAQHLSCVRFSTEPFLNSDCGPYVERMYECWQQDPKSVHVSWDAYFRNLAQNVAPHHAFTLPSSTTFNPSSSSSATSSSTPQSISDPYSNRVADIPSQSAFDTSKVIQLVRGYQGRGHEFAELDPLQLPHNFPYVSTVRLDARRLPIDYRAYGFTEQDLDRHFDCRVPGVTGFLSADRPLITLRQLVQRLEETYCGHIGIEANHIEDPNVTNYLRQLLEGEAKFEFSDDMKRRILVRTARYVSVGFPRICHRHTVTTMSHYVPTIGSMLMMFLC